jgi:hypothetical protein
MTPKRRAVLAKAQKASARKRRKGRNKRIAAIGITSVAVLGVGVAGYAGRNYIATVARGGPKRDYVNLPTQLALPPGRSVTKIKGKSVRPIPKRSGAFRVDSGGTVAYVRRPRGLYDAKRRAGLVSGYEKKVRSKYDGMSPRTQRRRKAKRG